MDTEAPHPFFTIVLSCLVLTVRHKTVWHQTNNFGAEVSGQFDTSFLVLICPDAEGSGYQKPGYDSS